MEQQPLKSSSPISTPPPMLPSRGRRLPPSVPSPHHRKVEISRSNSMDKSFFSQQYGHHTHSYPIDFESHPQSNPSGFNGRHSHTSIRPQVLSPTKESLLQHEKSFESRPRNSAKESLQDLRIRCQQMEKTMKWWSDCTANWRDKWSKVRAERNRYKDESKILKMKCESLEQELLRLKSFNSSRNSDLLTSDQCCQVELEGDLSVHVMPVTAGPPNPCQDETKIVEVTDSVDSGLNNVGSNSLEDQNQDFDQVEDQISRFLNDAVTSLASADHANMIKFRLDEALKTIEMERRNKKQMQQELESVQKDVQNLESQCDDLRLTRQELLRETVVLKSNQEEEMKSLRIEIEDEAQQKMQLEQIIGHLREETEQLQSENAEEWGKRERLETEKLNLERENRNLKTQVEDLKERTKRLTMQTNEQFTKELSRLQSQLELNSRELIELRHDHSRLKVNHSETLLELSHIEKKNDQSEKEVKKLRQRIDELRHDLGRAEDINDEHANGIRRLERTNEELNSQVEGYQVQIEHLQSRLKSLPQNNELNILKRTSRAQPQFPPPLYRPNQVFPDARLGNYLEFDRPVSVSSEETLPIFDDDIDISQEIETDV